MQTYLDDLGVLTDVAGVHTHGSVGLGTAPSGLRTATRQPDELRDAQPPGDANGGSHWEARGGLWLGTREYHPPSGRALEEAGLSRIGVRLSGDCHEGAELAAVEDTMGVTVVAQLDYPNQVEVSLLAPRHYEKNSRMWYYDPLQKMAGL